MYTLMMPTNLVSKTKRWAVLVPAMTLPLIASLFYFVIFSGDTLGQIIYTGTKVFTVIMPVIAVLWIFKEPHLFKRKESLKQHAKSLPLGIISGLAILGIMAALIKTPIWPEVLAGGPAIREKIVNLGILNHYLLFAIFVSFIHSLIEEYYWRWFVYGQLRQLVRPWMAHALAAISFAAHHIVVTTQFFSPTLGIIFGLLVGVGGLIWSLHYQRQGSLLSPWVSHMISDIGLLSFGYYLAGI